MRNLALPLLALAALAASAQPAAAADLFTHTFDFAGSVSSPIDRVGVNLSVMPGVESIDWATVSFGPFTPADVGRTVTLTPADASGPAPDFPRVADRLTDGVRHTIYVEWTSTAGGAGEGGWEPTLIYNNPDDPRVDLAGNAIDALRLRVDRLTLTPSAGRTDLAATFTLTAEGHAVPEPASE